MCFGENREPLFIRVRKCVSVGVCNCVLMCVHYIDQLGLRLSEIKWRMLVKHWVRVQPKQNP